MRACTAIAYAVALLLLIVTPSRTLHYVFTNLEPLCFVEEVHLSSAYLTGSYHRHDDPLTAHIKLELQLYDPSDTLLQSQSIDSGQHKFRFTIANGSVGSYKLCAAVVTQTFRPIQHSSLQASFDIDHISPIKSFKDDMTKKELSTRKTVNNQEVFVYTEYDGQKKSILYTKQFLGAVEIALDNIALSIEHINDEAKSFSLLLENMLRVSQSTNARAWALSICTVSAICIVVWYQFTSLRNTLVHRKIL